MTPTPDARILRGGLCLAEAQFIDRTPGMAWSEYQRQAAQSALEDAMTVFGFQTIEAARAYPSIALRVGLPTPAGRR